MTHNLTNNDRYQFMLCLRELNKAASMIFNYADMKKRIKKTVIVATEDIPRLLDLPNDARVMYRDNERIIIIEWGRRKNSYIEECNYMEISYNDIPSLCKDVDPNAKVTKNIGGLILEWICDK